MPVHPQLRHRLAASLQNDILSSRELRRLDAEIRTPEDARFVVDAIAERLGDDRLELTKYTRRERLDAFLGALDARFGLDLPEDGGVDLVGALVAARGAAPAPSDEDGARVRLPKTTFGGRTLEIDPGGELRRGDAPVDLGLGEAPSDAGLEARLGLLKPGQLDAIPDGHRASLAGALLDALEGALPLSVEGEGKFRRAVGAFASAGALAELAGALDARALERVEALVEAAPTPMTKALLLRTLEDAGAADRAAGLEAPEAKDHLLGVYDGLTAGQQRIGGRRPSEGARQFALTAAAFARNQAATENVFAGMKVYAQLNPARGWDAEEIGHMAETLERYVDAYPQLDYVVGTFSSDAPKDLAQLTNARVVEALEPKLSGPRPTFGQVPLTSGQAEEMKALLPGLENEAAVKAIEGALAECQDMFSGELRSRFEAAPRPREPLDPAAFALFFRRAEAALQAREGSKTGMIDAAALAEAVKGEARAVGADLAPRLAGLRAEPPRYGDVAVTPAVARRLEGLLRDRLKTPLTAANLATAVKVVADAHGGRIGPGAGEQALEDVLRQYEATFPGRGQLDFNKLGRMASFIVKGQDVPLSTLNGDAVGLAGFYRAVGGAVAKAAAGDHAEYPWMADRWGFRAMEATELLDVIAQKTAEGTGPVTELRQAHPGRSVSVEVTGAPGAHDQFVFRAEGVGRFRQGSDGRLERTRERPEPVLFTASVREDGAFDVKVPDAIRTREWPLQTTYAVGDSIDVFYKDPNAEDRWEEGERFETAHKILHGRIQSFDPNGTYRVQVTLPSGEETVKALSIREIERANNPHHFDLNGSKYSDVHMDVRSQPALAQIIEDAKPIIARHLPGDGALLDMAPAEIARRQRDCVEALMKLSNERMTYPAAKDSHPDAASQAYHDLIDGLGWYDTAPLGKLLELERGVCRHQCIVQQLLLQVAGIDSRLASGAANTRSGDYRGLHIWTEIASALDERFLSDDTWNDVAIPLWNGAYDVDARREEMYHRTARYDAHIV
jgi:hypothetical protein